jgi:hypothetical protein
MNMIFLKQKRNGNYDMQSDEHKITRVWVKHAPAFALCEDAREGVARPDKEVFEVFFSFEAATL